MNHENIFLLEATVFCFMIFNEALSYFTYFKLLQILR
jgi:hypothetical protein